MSEEIKTTILAAAKRLDALQGHLATLPQIDCPVTHRFTPGLYVREIFMPKGALIISKIHKTEHPFVVSKGHAAVWTEDAGVQQIKAPFCGTTKPGTRRVLFIHEDCVWTTFHPTNETDVEKIEEQIIEPRDVPPLMAHDVAAVLGLKIVRLQEGELCPG